MPFVARPNYPLRFNRQLAARMGVRWAYLADPVRASQWADGLAYSDRASTFSVTAGVGIPGPLVTGVGASSQYAAWSSGMVGTGEWYEFSTLIVHKSSWSYWGGPTPYFYRYANSNSGWHTASADQLAFSPGFDGTTVGVGATVTTHNTGDATVWNVVSASLSRDTTAKVPYIRINGTSIAVEYGGTWPSPFNPSVLEVMRGVLGSHATGDIACVLMFDTYVPQHIMAGYERDQNLWQLWQPDCDQPKFVFTGSSGFQDAAISLSASTLINSPEMPVQRDGSTSLSAVTLLNSPGLAVLRDVSTLLSAVSLINSPSLPVDRAVSVDLTLGLSFINSPDLLGTESFADASTSLSCVTSINSPSMPTTRSALMASIALTVIDSPTMSVDRAVSVALSATTVINSPTMPVAQNASASLSAVTLIQELISISPSITRVLRGVHKSFKGLIGRHRPNTDRLSGKA